MAVDQSKLLGGLLVAFIGLIIGIVLLTSLSDTIVGNTQLTSVSKETIVMSFDTIGNTSVSLEGITTVSDAAPISNERMTIVSDAAPISKEGMTIFSGTNTTVNANLINVTFFGNHTINTSTDFANLTENVNFTRAGVITVNDYIFNDSNATGVLYNITYTYEQNSTNTTVNANLINVTFFGNQTVNTSLDTTNLTAQVNFTKAGVVLVSPTLFGEGLYNISYTYDQNSTNTTANKNVIGVSFFGNQTVNTSQDTANVTSQVNFTAPGVITVNSAIFGDGLYNISYHYSVNVSGTTTNTNYVSGVSFFGNTTLNTSLSGITVGAAVNFTTVGAININPINFTAGNYEISYTYEGSTYVPDRASRAILPLIPIFFALFVFLFGVVLVFQSGITEGFK